MDGIVTDEPENRSPKRRTRGGGADPAPPEENGMPKMIFVNLPVDDVAKSTAFYESLGARRDPRFCNETTAMMSFSDTIHVMLLTHDKYRQFTSLEIADARCADLCTSEFNTQLTSSPPSL